MDAILDTSVIIELFRGNEKVLRELQSREDTVYGISVITLFELYCGSLKEKEKLFLEEIPKLGFDEKSAKYAGMIYKELREKGKTPKVKDLLIASSAIAHSKILYTCNSDFSLFREYGLKLVVLEA